MTKRQKIMALLLAFLAGLSLVYHWYINPPHEVLMLEGKTMGTYYTIKAVRTSSAPDLDSLHTKIEDTLQRINSSLSTWDQNSQISRFNADAQSLSPLQIDSDFAAVMAASQKIFAASAGAFNPALEPLIALWGFGREPDDSWPEPEQIEAALLLSNFESIRFTPLEPATIQRIQPGVALNFSAIAKGYGVDQLLKVILDAGYTDALVDIGGELRAVGMNDQQAWRVGIEKPDNALGTVQAITELHDEAIATSGNYRNFRIKNGQRFSHIIDPRTGYPITHSVASVSVRAEDTMTADGWATALYVMGLEGMEVCETLKLACMMIAQEAEEFRVYESSAWQQ